MITPALNPSSRRTFLKTGAMVAAGSMLPRFATGSSGPSALHRLNVGFIGAGGVVNQALDGCRGENYVAFCDVDEDRAAGTYAAYPDARRFRDYRDMLERLEHQLDAVVISTPDHHHFAAAYLAISMGKPVFVQKPLTHNIWQARTLQKAAHYYDVITQMGNQGHTTEGIRLVKEWYDADVIGDVREVHAWFDGPNFDGPYFRMPESFPPATRPVPTALDYDLWLGPVARRDYSAQYTPLTWRGWWDFGCGELGDWACHTLDAPFWALDLGMPERVSVAAIDTVHETFCPRSSHLVFEFPARGSKPPVKLHWYDGGAAPDPKLIPEWPADMAVPRRGMVMIGDKHTLMTGARPDSPRLLNTELWNDFRQAPPAKTIARVKGGPFQEWIRAIKGEGPLPGSNFDYAAALTEMAHVGVLAQRTGRDIEYNAATMEITNHDDLGEMIREPARAGWDFGREVWR
ncbi:Gfo/Idh/MocA family oxidoreductase [Synoicihabitans lomoniglobus]|uniref:Gfo/Idh/MocA family oxidoreductase n=1 Tax=Synoicihabitans lomoniglobus TaxID=2909285 RepID=A0AAF0CSN4_9BACT|nr:Gfo/Idh/MocA family oxidoreductase [Opitutaceae bacterium LMO-M01]WED67308.1 Gfo/Idh/MocA family oxidoreductase [Opitutaceae bacterium LMO-M01]